MFAFAKGRTRYSTGNELYLGRILASRAASTKWGSDLSLKELSIFLVLDIFTVT